MKIGRSISQDQSAVTPFKPHITHPGYRPDIDGLRAIAVLSVVGFHAFPVLAKGGYVGVDIFFVISGFLISTIIFGSINLGAFSFFAFYGRRIRRIFPALILVLAASYLVGWFALFPDEYKQLGKHIAAGAGFVSNFALWNESGYFDNASDTKPLLHLWSLGIEEQFYIVWPLVLWATWKLRLNLLTITIIITLSSFTLNIMGIHKNAIATFYSPQTRIWELLSGSLLAWFSLYGNPSFSGLKHKLNCWLGRIFPAITPEALENRLRDIQSIVGVTLILTAVYFIRKEFSFPGWWALLPVSGATLVIAAGAHAWANRVLLSNRILVWFGLISYPLYLWHWPLLSFARIVEGETPGRETRAVIVGASILLAWLTYKYIEKPFRFGHHTKSKICVLLFFMAIMGFIGYNTYTSGGLEFRMKDRADFISYFENARPEWRYFQKTNLPTLQKRECAFFDYERYRLGLLNGNVRHSTPRESISATCYERNSKYKKSVLLLGDSHAQALSPGLQKYLPSDYQLLQVATAACPLDLNTDEPSATKQCEQSNYMATRTVSLIKPDVVVLSQQGWKSIGNIQDIVTRVKELGAKRVVLVGSTPRWKSHLPKLLARHPLYMPRRMNTGLKLQRMTQNSRFRQQFRPDSSQVYFDVMEIFCDAGGCLTYLGDDVKTGITTWDYGHLTPIASEYLAEKGLVDAIIGLPRLY
jgi:peptidoglycan/LPS O-acetylase OafA/YrhL